MVLMPAVPRAPGEFVDELLGEFFDAQGPAREQVADALAGFASMSRRPLAQAIVDLLELDADTAAALVAGWARSMASRGLTDDPRRGLVALAEVLALAEQKYVDPEVTAENRRRDGASLADRVRTLLPEPADR